ncbi:NAD(P)/FAD-dependent oxidoreductase [Oceanicoccus sp. KOV_DT_Chl]|uniref:FAD-dependent oxidoreductase n=1 Tax=Oceanicoccus sp. KOV_DT_Chl TaxID=1904639 RepID=UPI000C79589B|nr:FAD-dependent monooxygenase [Oceanicoccus sp. KOV_DT_Chl]
MTSELPILISGAGPTGLTLALALGKAGYQVEVFEAEAELADEIRASTIHASTLEFWDQLGVADRIIAKGKKSSTLKFYERGTEECVASFDYSLIEADTKFPFRLQCPQNIITRELLPAALETGNVRVHMAHASLRFEDHGESVTLYVDTPSGKELVVEGQYLCACDGPRSPARIQLDIKFPEVSVYEDRFLLIGTDIDLPAIYPDIGPVAYFYDPEEWIICMELPTMTRTIFRIPPDVDTSDLKSEESCRRRLEKVVGKDYQYNIKVVNYYSVLQRAAETFRVGRVCLAGDAAHLNNPTGGQGLNSGVQDAVMLAEKLISVLQGGADAALDEYSIARRDYHKNMVQQKAAKNYSDLVLTEAEDRAKRNEAMKAMATDPAQARAYLLRASMLDHRIEQSHAA